MNGDGRLKTILGYPRSRKFIYGRKPARDNATGRQENNSLDRCSMSLETIGLGILR
jgi:hypothetical protein